MNFCFKNAVCPSQWRSAYLVPLYKGKGAKTDPNSYRGISLLPALYKCYSSILYRRLLQWVENFKLLPLTQFGFRPKCSTITATKSLLGYIKYEISRMSRCYVCFIDYEKAFDKVDRNLLFTKLQNLGLSRHFTEVLFTLYKQNFLMVLTDGVLTDKISQTLGVPQGDKLSPILFSLFIADLSALLESTGCFIIFYADDLAIASSSIESLQHALDKLESYCALNLMTVNISKTKVMKFRRGGTLSNSDRVRYKNQTLEFVSKFKYLGLVLSTTLSPSPHLKNLSQNARASSGSLLKKMNLTNTSSPSAQRLYSSVICPSGMY